MYGRALGGPDRIEGLLMNMSEGGFSFEAAATAKIKAHFDFEVSAPAEEGSADKLTVKGQVRWCAPSQDQDGAYWIGVMFEPLDDAQKQVIDRFVADYTLPDG